MKILLVIFLLIFQSTASGNLIQNAHIQQDYNTKKTNKQEWIYFQEPFALQSFPFNTLNQAIPKSIKARKAKLLIFLWTGNDSVVQFKTRTRVEDFDDCFIHWTYALQWTQYAVSYNSETVQIPCFKTRQLRVKSSHTRVNAVMQYFITGYLL